MEAIERCLDPALPPPDGLPLVVRCASASDLGKHSCIALGKRKRDEREMGLAALLASLLSRREAISRVRDKVTR
jgi:hypothetical protein